MSWSDIPNLLRHLTWIEINGYAASAAVLATFLMPTMIPLRIVALFSNVLFILYGYFDSLYPVLFLHALLFPINLVRLLQFRALVNDIRKAQSGGISIETLLPYMNSRNFAAGETIVRKGEIADRLFFLASGEVEILEMAKRLHPGVFLGEIGVFAADQARTSTVVCRTDCKTYELTERVAKQLYFQDRAFGFAVMQLIINRLLENNRRLLEKNA